MKYIDNFLNKITMYRIVLYSLLTLVAAAFVLSLFGILHFNPLLFVLGILFIIAVSVASNGIFAKVFNAPTNIESVYITALILALIISPMQSTSDMGFIALAFWASTIATASKYILAIGKKHIFNPAAIAVVITAFFMNLSASWWVGTGAMLPFVLITGFLITRKIVRGDLVVSFLLSAFIVILATKFGNPGSIPNYFITTALDVPLFFFATIMLTEPLTTPPTRILRIWYGVFVGVLFAPFAHIGSISFTPELALVVGNIFSYIVSPKVKPVLSLTEKIKLTPNIYDFVFESDKTFSFKPGQYLEWTLGHEKADNRGNRRYFTIASSPTEKNIHLGVKFYDHSSSFKKALFSLKEGDEIVATGLAGDFTLPKNKKEKLVFIAGGIGVTPFRSMIKYLADKNEKRNIVFLYSNPTLADIAYKDVFEDARARIGLRTIYAVTRESPQAANPSYYFGRIAGDMIAKAIPDFSERHFYISGTHDMVTTCNAELAKIGVKKSNIKTDFFPGFA